VVALIEELLKRDELAEVMIEKDDFSLSLKQHTS
jgi:hypothetical protein